MATEGEIKSNFDIKPPDRQIGVWKRGGLLQSMLMAACLPWLALSTVQITHVANLDLSGDADVFMPGTTIDMKPDYGLLLFANCRRAYPSYTSNQDLWVYNRHHSAVQSLQHSIDPGAYNRYICQSYEDLILNGDFDFTLFTSKIQIQSSTQQFALSTLTYGTYQTSPIHVRTMHFMAAGTSLLYVAGYRGERGMFDIITSSITPKTAVIPGSTSSYRADIMCWRPIDDNVILFVDNEFIAFIERSTLILLHLHDWYTPHELISAFITDKSRREFHLAEISGAMNTYALSDQLHPAVGETIRLSVLWPNYWHHIADLSPFNLLLFSTYEATSKMIVVGKDDHGTRFTYTGGSISNLNRLHALIGETVYVTGSGLREIHLYFSQVWVNGSTNTAATYRLEVTSCGSLDTNGACLSCPTDGYTFKLHQNSESCSPIDEMPNGFGLNLTTMTVDKCRDPNCLQCRYDHTKCTYCKSGGAIKGDKCYGLNAGYPIGFGKVVNGLGMTDYLTACTKSNCRDCSANHAVCSRCNDGYALDSAGDCFHYRSMVISDTSKSGYNKNTFMLDSCVDPHCVDCREDITVCLFCSTQSSYVLWQGVCVPRSSPPAGFGPKAKTHEGYSGTEFSKCNQNHCIKCENSVDSCQICAPTPTNQTFKHGNECKYPFQLPLGYGANWATNMSAVCSDSYCLDCAENYTMCRICDSALTPPRYNYLNSCVLKTSIPNGYGIEIYGSGHNNVIPCKMPNCIVCSSHAYHCSKCGTFQGEQLFAYDGRCMYYQELPSGVGRDTSLGEAKYCQDPNCYYCRADFRICTKCNTGLSPPRFLHNTQCLEASTLPDTYGAFTGNYTSRPCLNPNCLKCQSDYATGCTECKWGTTPQTYLLNSECLTAQQLPLGKGAHPSSPIAVDCDPAVSCNWCKYLYTECNFCKSGYYLLGTTCYTLATIPDNYGAGTDNKAYSCAVSNCKICTSNYKNCEKCHNSPTIYYLHVANNSCLTMSHIPNGYGAKIVSTYGETAACTVPSCNACQTDYTTCGTCSQNTPPKWVYSNTCTLETSLPNGYGGDPVSGNALPCLNSNCLKCQPNYQSCTQCKSQVPELYLLESTGQCLTASSLPDGYGPNSTTKKAVPCTVTNCTNCRASPSVCSACNSSGAYPNYLLLGACYMEFNLPQLYGADNSTYMAMSCSSNRCLNCSQDSTSCQQCDSQTPELYIYFDGIRNQCITSAEMPDGKGPEPTSLIVRDCSVTGCQKCQSNFAVCDSCNTSIFPLLYFHAGSCRIWQDLPDPYGANDITRIATRCESSSCVSCKQNHTFCNSCSRSNPETFLYPDNGTCVDKNQITEGWGPDFSSYQLRTCLNPDCKICNDNFAFCKLCKTIGQPLYTSEGNCYRINEIPAGHGCDNSTYQIQSCQSVGCKNCLYDYKMCVECVDPPEKPTLANPKYYLKENVCTPCTASPLRVINHVCQRLPCTDNTCLITLKNVISFKSRKQLKAQFSANIALNKSIGIKVRIEAPESNINRDLNKHEYDISVIGDVLLISLTVAENEVRGTILLDRVNSEEHPIHGAGNDLVFFDYPVKWGNVYLLQSKTGDTLLNIASSGSASTASAKAIAQLIIITKSSNIAKIPDMMVSNMVYLQLMNGETYLYPTIVFDFFANSYLPFINLTNPFDPKLRNPNCLVAPKMFEAEIDCGILSNYGIDVMIVYATLAINILVSLIHYGLYGAKLRLFKKHRDKVNVEKMEKSIGFRVLSFLNDSYGMKMSLVKLDGTVVEVLFYSALTISSQPIVSVNYLWSVLVSFSFIGYYVWSMYSYLRLIIFITPGLNKIRGIEEERKKTEGSKYRPKQINHYVDFTRVKHGLVGYQIEDYRADIPYIYMFAPVVWFLRCIAINIFLIGGTNMKSGQYYVYIIIETAYLYYLVKSQVKASRFENWLSYFNEGSQIAYVTLQAISYQSSDVDMKQKHVGLMQAVMLSTIMIVNIGYTFVVFFWQVMIQPIVRRCKKKPAEEKARINEDQLRGETAKGQTNLAKEKPKQVTVSSFRSILQRRTFVSNPHLARPEPNGEIARPISRNSSFY